MSVLMQLRGINMLKLAILLLVGSAAVHADEIEKGEKLYRQCAGCHQIGPGASNAFGPMLNGVMQRTAANVAGFDYSDAFSDAMAPDIKWNSSSLSAFLEAPMTNIPGTKMAFPGIKSEDDRASIIAYLAAVDADGKIASAANTDVLEGADSAVEKNCARWPQLLPSPHTAYCT